MFWLFGCQACVISAPQSGIKLAPPVLEGEALTTTLPGKFQANTFQLLFQVPKMSLTTLKLPPPTPHLWKKKKKYGKGQLEGTLTAWGTHG